MKAHLCHVFPSFVSGGSQVRTTRLMNALGETYRHSIIALDGELGAGELIEPGVPWEPISGPPKGGSLGTTRALVGLLRGLAPDLLCTYNWGAIDALMAATWVGGIGTLHHEDGFGADEAIRPKRRRTWMRRLVLPRAQGVLVPSRNLEEIAIQRWRLKPERVHHIPIGIRWQDFPRADGHPELRQGLGIPGDAWVLGSVGHLRPEKNPVRLLQAFSQLKDVSKGHLLMLGEGQERAALEADIQRLGLATRVSLVGYQSSPAPYYQAMDCLAISSDTEQMPVNLLEAMAAGLPVVSTDVGDVRHMLPPAQAEFVVPINRQEERATLSALAERLGRLQGDRALAASLGAENHAHLTRTYSFEGMLERFQGHYERALDAGRAH